MNQKQTTHTSDWTHNWNGSIAIKLTAIILWSVMIAAFILTVPIMFNYEDQKLKEYLWNNQQLVNLIEKSINANRSEPDIKNELKIFIDNNEIEYVSIDISDIDISATTTHANTTTITHGISSEKNYKFPASKILTENKQIISISIEHHILKRVVIIDRVILGSSILFFATLFGAFIYIVTNNIVNKPIQNFVKLTHKISNGETNVVFDELRDDEFGELSRFSNQMLRNLESQRTELVDANKDLIIEIQNREEALAASHQKSEFLANMSHEIRTPLSSIIGYTERLRYKNIESDAKKNEMMDIVLQSSTHLLSLINDILDFSKIEADKLEVVSEEFSIISTVNHTVDLLHDKALEQSTELKVEYTFPIPETIINDATRTKQILFNLCGNALRFTKNGTITIQISFDENADKLIIAIKDTGIGMSEKSLGRLFKAFSQGEKNTSNKYGGTGLGLVISKKLCELMGGNITVISTEDLGSIFTFNIDAGFKSGQTLISEIDSTQLSSANYSQPPVDLKLSGKILLVEDTIEIRKLVQAYLEDYGLDITTAENGKEGSDLALNGDFDVVIMDIQMPVMNGKEAVKRLREKNYNKPVLALTADAFTQQVDEYLSLGFTKILTKPIIINDLIKTLSYYLNSSNDIATHKKETSTNNTLSDLQKKFIDQLSGNANEINLAINNNDADTAMEVLHKLIGIGGSLGLPDVSKQAKYINNALINKDIDNARTALERFKNHIAEL